MLYKTESVTYYYSSLLLIIIILPRNGRRLWQSGRQTCGSSQRPDLISFDQRLQQEVFHWVGTQIKLISRAPQHERQVCQISVFRSLWIIMPRMSVPAVDHLCHDQVMEQAQHCPRQMARFTIKSTRLLFTIYSVWDAQLALQGSTAGKSWALRTSNVCQSWAVITVTNISVTFSPCRCLDHKIHRIGIHGNGGRWNTETGRDDSGTGIVTEHAGTDIESRGCWTWWRLMWTADPGVLLHCPGYWALPVAETEDVVGPTLTNLFNKQGWAWRALIYPSLNDGQSSFETAQTWSIQYNFIAKCQYTDCTRNVLWCQVHSSHIHSNHKTFNYNNSK